MDHEGDRHRYWHERAALEQRQAQNSPIRFDDLSQEMRGRIGREIDGFADDGVENIHTGRRINLRMTIVNEIRRVLGTDYSGTSIAKLVAKAPRDHLLTILEISARVLVANRKRSDDVAVLQSILADDSFGFRFRPVGRGFQLQRIDNEHLHRDVIDRTFELTRSAQFAAAQADYADAWRAYSDGDLKNALISAARAVESAVKASINAADPSREVTKKKLRQLVPILAELDLFPSQMQTIAAQLACIFENSGCLRNQETIAHGSLEPGTPDASVALLGLRLGGTLISFLAERTLQVAAS